MTSARAVVAAVLTATIWSATASGQPGDDVPAQGEGTPATPPPAAPPAGPRARVPNHDACVTGVQTLDSTFYTAAGEDPATVANPCEDLAQIVRAELVDPAGDAESVPAAEVVEPDAPALPGNQDGVGQTSATPSGEPVPQAGGTLGLTGTAGSGLQLVTALAVNPVGAATDPKDSRRYAWGSRAVDASLVIPVGLDATSVAEKGFQFVGVHVRINVPWLYRGAAGSKLVEEVEASFKKFLDASGKFIELLDGILQNAPNPGACARAVIDQDAVAQRLACGIDVDTDLVTDAFKETPALIDARREADRYYATIETRADWGDVNGDGAAPNDSLFGVYASLGMRVGNSATKIVALRGRFGLASFTDGAMDTGVTIYYVAGGVDLGLVVPNGRFSFSAGFEKQWGKGMLAAGTEFQNARVGITVPVASGKSISVGISIPADRESDEDREPTITVNGDWATLFAN